jgi:hypothetical protein
MPAFEHSQFFRSRDFFASSPTFKRSGPVGALFRSFYSPLVRREKTPKKRVFSQSEDCGLWFWLILWVFDRFGLGIDRFLGFVEICVKNFVLWCDFWIEIGINLRKIVVFEVEIE